MREGGGGGGCREGMFGRKGGTLSGVAMLTRVWGSSKVWTKANWFEPVCFNEICFFWREKQYQFIRYITIVFVFFFVYKIQHGKHNLLSFSIPLNLQQEKKHLFGGRNGTVSPAAILICFCCLSIPLRAREEGGGLVNNLAARPWARALARSRLQGLSILKINFSTLPFLSVCILIRTHISVVLFHDIPHWLFNKELHLLNLDYDGIHGLPRAFQINNELVHKLHAKTF